MRISVQLAHDHIGTCQRDSIKPGQHTANVSPKRGT